MTNLEKTIADSIVKHWEDYAAAMGVLGVAIVSCIPAKVPKTLQEWWTWMRESLQTAIPAARHPVFPQEPNEVSTETKQEK